jgi:hypothetical protein
MTTLLQRVTWWSIAPVFRPFTAGSLFISRIEPSRPARRSRRQVYGTGFSPGFPGNGNHGIGILDELGFGNLILQNIITQVSDTGIILGPNDLADGNFVTGALVGIFSDPSSKLKNNTVTMATTIPFQGGTKLPGTNF